VTTLTVLTLLFLAFAVPVSAEDIRTMHISSWLTYTGCAVLLAYLYIFAKAQLADRLAGAVLIFILFLLLRHTTHRGLGMGDVKFSLLCGLYCGVPGVFAGCALAAVGGLLYFAVFHILKRNIPIKSVKIPFAPFMTAGVVASVYVLGKLV
jgi:Type IV leader peptidase family.